MFGQAYTNTRGAAGYEDSLFHFNSLMLGESFRVVSVSMGQGLGLASISEARASAWVSMYSRILVTLPF